MLVPAWEEPLRQNCDESHPHRVDRLLIKTAAGQTGIGDNDGQIRGNAPGAEAGAELETGHVVVTDTNPDRSS